MTLEEQRDFDRAELAGLWPPASIPVLPGDQVTRYYRELAERPSFAEVIANARPYRHLFPLRWPADFDRHH